MDEAARSLPWRVSGNKIVDRSGRTILVVFAQPSVLYLRLIVARVNDGN
jgi:hypothetical protein